MKTHPVTHLPQKRPLASAIAQSCGQSVNQEGFGLLGLILTLALSTAVVGIAYTAYTANVRSSNVAAATSSVRELNQRVLASYSSAADFTGLSNTSALRDGVYPAGLLVNGQPQSVWSGAITLTSVNLNGGTDNGFALTYNGVDPNTCANFVTNAGHGFYDVTINGKTAMSGRQVPAVNAVALCSAISGPSTVQFIQAKQSPQGAQNVVLSPCSVPAPQSQYVACPTGQESSVAPYSVNGVYQTRQGFCAGPYGASGFSPWATQSNTCAPICVAPATVVTPGSQTSSCPAGQVTIASGASTFPQTNTQTTTYACPAPTGPYTTNVAAPTPWTPTAATVCAPQCVAPAPTSVSPTQSASCPAGQVTSSGATTFTQTDTITTTYACPAPTGPYTPTVGSPTAWTPAVASVCAPKCVAPAPTSQSPTQVVSCPAGQAQASGATSLTQTETRSVTYTCPAPQGSYTTAYGPYSPWTPTLSCAPVCVAPGPSSGTQTLTCPSGQSGAIQQSRTVTYSCPAPTGAYNTAYGPWTTTSNTCANNCVAPPTGYVNGTQSCPSGQSGSISTQQPIYYSCPAPTGPYTTTPGPVGITSNTCANNCVAPATVNTPQSQTITVTPGCPAGQTGSYYYSQNQTRTATTTYSCPAPTGPYTTNPTTYSGWVNSGGGYNVVNTCVTPPPACVTSVGQFTVTSFKLTITSAEGSSASTTTIGSPVHAGSSSYNLSGVATVTGTYGGVSYTISSLTGMEYAQVAASANCPVYAVASGCNPTHTGSLPPGLDFEMDLFGESQGVAYMKTRTCP
jgi:Tfp pilus assembly protein PilE